MQTKFKLSRLAMNTGQVPGLPKNPRQWTATDVDRLARSIQETPELLDARPLIVVEHGNKFVVLGGNLRLAALKKLGWDEAPCYLLPADAPVDKLKEIVIKDNGSFGQWDYDLLANEWDDLPLADFGVPSWEGEAEPAAPEVKEDEFNEDAEVETRCNPGDIWQLGEHRLMCGDSTDGGNVALLMGGAKADLVFTDPPYGMKKESDGVLNDNLNYDDLLEFNRRWIPVSFSFLKDNGSWYCWGIDEPLMDIYSNILKPMQDDGRITFRNLLTWDKGSGQGQNADGLRMYSVADEKCLFVMAGFQDQRKRNDREFNDRFEGIRSYFEDAKNDSGLSTNDLSKIDSTRVSHYWAKVQYEFPTEKSYKKLQSRCPSAFYRKYDELKAEYDKIQNLAYFDNTHDNMNNVWHFDRTGAEERKYTGGHATPKPIALCARGIKTSSREGETVLDLFGGSGSTLIAAEQLGRRCYMMELDPHYCDIILARWEKFTGKKATRIE